MRLRLGDDTIALLMCNACCDAQSKNVPPTHDCAWNLGVRESLGDIHVCMQDSALSCDGFISDAEDDPITDAPTAALPISDDASDTTATNRTPADGLTAASESAPCALCTLREDHAGQMWMCMRNCTCQSHKSCLELWRYDCHNLCHCGAPISKTMLYSRYIGCVCVIDRLFEKRHDSMRLNSKMYLYGNRIPYIGDRIW